MNPTILFSYLLLARGAIRFGDYNVGREGQLLTLPSYMQFLLDLEPEEAILKPIDAEAVNALAKDILDQRVVTGR